MKKLLALALALAMMLGTVNALALNLDQGVTILVEGNLDENLFNQLVSAQMGSSSQQNAVIVSNVIKLINKLGLQLSAGGNAAEVDILLNGTNLAAVGLTTTPEGGLAAISDLVPNYAVTVAPETLQQLINALQQQLSGMSGLNIDPDALMNAIMPHVQELANAIAAKVGEPQNGLFTVDGYIFNTKVPVNMTLKELALALVQCANGILGESEVRSLISQIASMTGSYINMSSLDLSSTIQEIQSTPDDQLPEMEFALYQSNNGEYLVLDLTQDGQTIQAHFGLIGNSIVVNVNALDQTKIQAVLTVDEQAGSVNGRVDVEAQGQYVGFTLNVNKRGNAYVGEAALYYLNRNTPAMSLRATVTPGAAFTLNYNNLAAKTAIPLETLIGGGDSTATNNLLMDLQVYGLPTLLQKATQAMPNEVNALLQLVMGAQQNGY